MFIFMELMENGPMEAICKDIHGICYSEKFVKYTLYKVAKGLSKMHSRNVLHRDVKS